MKHSDSSHYFHLDNDQSANKLNVEPFIFEHSLNECRLLSFDSLAETILTLPPAQVFFSSGDVDLTANLDTAHKTHKPKVTLENALENIESAGAFVMVREPEFDPRFKDLFHDLTEDVKKYASRISPGLHDFKLYLFIASPNSVTPYHIDRYSTFLFQLQGHKDVNVWTPWDKSLVSDLDLERFFCHEQGFSPSLKDNALDKAIVSHIHPGQAVHIPFVSPHWIKNSDEVSVSISIIFNSKKTANIANALRYNSWYRKSFNKSSKPVNTSNFKDSAKATVYKSYQAIKSKTFASAK